MARLHSPLREFPVFGSQKSRGTAEFAIRSRRRRRTLISDGWMSCVSLKGTEFEALWRTAEGVPSFFLPFFFKFAIAYTSNETKSRRERARSSACWDFASNGTFTASDVKIRSLCVSRPFVRPACPDKRQCLFRSIYRWKLDVCLTKKDIDFLHLIIFFTFSR